MFKAETYNYHPGTKKEPSIQMLALVRLGVPPEIAQYIVSIDIKGLTVIGTPKLRQTWKAAKEQCFHDISQEMDPEKTETFTAQRGTGQGDVSSSLL